MMNRTLALGVGLILVAAACGTPAATDGAGSSSFTVQTTTTCVSGSDTCDPELAVPVDAGEIVPTPVPLNPPPAPSPTMIARTDLALRLGVPMDHIEVISVEEVVWRDGNLGCDTGAPAIQVLTDGYRIVLSVHDVEYSYHGKTGSDPVFCAIPDEPLPPGDV